MSRREVWVSRREIWVLRRENRVSRREIVLWGHRKGGLLANPWQGSTLKNSDVSRHKNLIDCMIWFDMEDLSTFHNGIFLHNVLYKFIVMSCSCSPIIICLKNPKLSTCNFLYEGLSCKKCKILSRVLQLFQSEHKPNSQKMHSRPSR